MNKLISRTCVLIAALFISSCALLGQNEPDEELVCEIPAGFYELHRTGFPIWCYSEGDCEEPPEEQMVNTMKDACSLYAK